jgi:hypothetical protein
MTEEPGGFERERDILIRSIEEALEALRVAGALGISPRSPTAGPAAAR